MSKPSMDLVDKLRDLRYRFGLEVTEEQYDENNFGNAYMVLTAHDFAVRTVRERGQVFTGLALPAQKWVT
jgi:hypothetical protein